MGNVSRLHGHVAAAPAAVALETVDAAVARLRPADPLSCLRPGLIAATARTFVGAFPGQVFYAVKCNPDPAVLAALGQGGIRHLDVASLTEIEVARRHLPQARLAYMHPVKPRESIAAAYHVHGVRDFALDTLAELRKIQDATGGAADCGLIVRLKLPKGGAVYDLSAKFGAEAGLAADLLRAARALGARAGLCFHVGSQCLEPDSYARALVLAGEVARAAGVELDVIDVGGGFPVSYPGQVPPPLGAYWAAIAAALPAVPLAAGAEVWCEPGRALVAAGGSLVVQVQARRGDELFLNDGVYGSLSDAGFPAWRFPARLVRPEGPSQAERRDFIFWGPTCDSADRMAGPFSLPGDIREGDWIEIGQLGAYGDTLRTAFNGFDRLLKAQVADAPQLATPGHPDGVCAPAAAPAATSRLFFFGSLMDRDLLALVLDRGLDDLGFGQASLLGFRRRRVAGETYPMLVPHPGGEVPGLLVDGLTAADLDRLRFYETDDYRLQAFDLVTAAGRVRAEVFVATDALSEAGEGWDPAMWLAAEKPMAMAAAAELMAHYRVTPVAQMDSLWGGIKDRAARRVYDRPRGRKTWAAGSRRRP